MLNYGKQHCETKYDDDSEEDSALEPRDIDLEVGEVLVEAVGSVEKHKQDLHEDESEVGKA